MPSHSLFRHFPCGLFLVATVWNQSFTMAGIIADGIADADYQNFAAQFPASGMLAGPQGVGSGTLIAPNWVLTAGHVSDATTFQLGGTGTIYNVAQIILHPSFVANGTDLAYGFDIALYRLDTAIAGATPAQIYRGSNEVGSTIAIAGFGQSGIGLNPVLDGTNLHRAGTNTADLVFSFANGSMGQVGATNSAFIADFDAPDGIGTPGQYNTLSAFGSSPALTPLEYQVANGDSGGGAYIFDNGTWYLAGIASAVTSQQQLYSDIGSPLPGNTNSFGYGASSIYTRVSSFQTFIDSNLNAVPEPSSSLLFSLSLLILKRRRPRVKAAF